MKVLNVIESAYCAPVGRLGDPVARVMRAVRIAGGDITIYLRGNAVNYMVRPPSAAAKGSERQGLAKAAGPGAEIVSLMAMEVPVYVDVIDLRERGLYPDELIHGTRPVDRSFLPRLFADHERIWYW